MARCAKLKRSSAPWWGKQGSNTYGWCQFWPIIWNIWVSLDGNFRYISNLHELFSLKKIIDEPNRVKIVASTLIYHISTTSTNDILVNFYNQWRIKYPWLIITWSFVSASWIQVCKRKFCWDRNPDVTRYMQTYKQWRLAAVPAEPVWYHFIFKVWNILLALLSFFNHTKLNQPWNQTEGRVAEHTIASLWPSGLPHRNPCWMICIE